MKIEKKMFEIHEKENVPMTSIIKNLKDQDITFDAKVWMKYAIKAELPKRIAVGILLDGLDQNGSVKAYRKYASYFDKMNSRIK